MPTAHFADPLPLATGQRYRINSFDLGFIEITPVDMLVEIRAIRTETNQLELAPFPAPGEGINCIFKNARAFERLVDLGIAILENAVAEPIGGRRAL